jgi:hypothetical protein
MVKVTSPRTTSGCALALELRFDLRPFAVLAQERADPESGMDFLAGDLDPRMAGLLAHSWFST